MDNRVQLIVSLLTEMIEDNELPSEIDFETYKGVDFENDI
jgi:hypothetical protein